MGDDRPPVYWEGTKKLVIRASAIGHPCLWELVAAGQNVDSSGAPPWMKRAFQEGHLAEPGIVKELIEKYRFEFESHQDEGELLILRALTEDVDVVMRYHPDGIGNIPDVFCYEVLDLPEMIAGYKTVVVEIKHLSDVLWQQAVRHGVQTTIPDYEWQLSGMMIKERLPGLWACKNKGKFERGKDGVRREVYTPDKGKLFFQYVPEPLVTYPEFIERAREILDGVQGEDLLTSDRPCDSPDHFPCLYRHVRPEPSEEDEMAKKNRVTWRPEGEMAEKVDEVVARLRKYKGQIKEAEDGYEREAKLLDELIPKGIEAVQTDKWGFNVSPSHSGGYRWDEMPAELKEELKRYKKSEVTGRHTRDYKRND